MKNSDLIPSCNEANQNGSKGLVTKYGEGCVCVWLQNGRGGGGSEVKGKGFSYDSFRVVFMPVKSKSGLNSTSWLSTSKAYKFRRNVNSSERISQHLMEPLTAL